MDLIITILPVVTKDLPISPRFTPYNFLSRCKFSTLTTRQPMVEFYLLISNSVCFHFLKAVVKRKHPRMLCIGGPPPYLGTPPTPRDPPPCTAGPTSPTTRAPPFCPYTAKSPPYTAGPTPPARSPPPCEIPPPYTAGSPPLYRGIPPPPALRDPPLPQASKIKNTLGRTCFLVS